ncbi:MAG: NADH-quinone oxidoreductase subunit A [Candidatus Micrarchaeota archaeon]|nr:NADH-quinone oxidoreductase subunit A [Candidatus Micrarchaeota archaeon]
MDYTFVVVFFFGAIALFVPLSMLLLARLLGTRTRQNPVKLDNYESAETPIGTKRDITTEYLHYFPLYLGFEMVIVVLLGWGTVYTRIGQMISLGIIGLSGVAFVLAAFALAMAHSKERDVSYGR